jgi:aminoglycoside phosphotransferase (APT) family kinase protein
MPAAEFDVTADLVRRLLAGQHPDLAGLAVEPLSNGWDNTLFRLGDELVARLPRRALGAQILVNEQRWLPSLAPRLPLPVPVPVRTGGPADGYPWPWSVTKFLPGTPAADNPPFSRARAAADLGAFFAALHVPAPADAPANPFRGVPLERRADSFASNLETLAGQVDRDAVLAAWETALAVPPWTAAPVWLHGDPHPANILVSDGRVSAVLDFGDITAGDPAADLCLAWMLLPLEHHRTFRAAYAAAAQEPAEAHDAAASGQDQKARQDQLAAQNPAASQGRPAAQNPAARQNPAAGQGQLARHDAAGAGQDPAASDNTWARARGWALNMALVFLAWSADNPQLHAVGQRTLTAVLASH